MALVLHCSGREQRKCIETLNIYVCSFCMNLSDIFLKKESQPAWCHRATTSLPFFVSGCCGISPFRGGPFCYARERERRAKSLKLGSICIPRRERGGRKEEREKTSFSLPLLSNDLFPTAFSYPFSKTPRFFRKGGLFSGFPLSIPLSFSNHSSFKLMNLLLSLSPFSMESSPPSVSAASKSLKTNYFLSKRGTERGEGSAGPARLDFYLSFPFTFSVFQKSLHSTRSPFILFNYVHAPFLRVFS